MGFPPFPWSGDVGCVLDGNRGLGCVGRDCGKVQPVWDSLWDVLMDLEMVFLLID